MSSVAFGELWPPALSNIVLRAVFLNVGQGDSTLFLIRDGTDYKSLLVDINLDAERGGIDVPQLLGDLLPNGTLDVFVNTHPHEDHLRGISELAEVVDVRDVWHSGHIPSQKHCPMYGDLQDLIATVEDRGGTVLELAGSQSMEELGNAAYQVLAPAEYVTDDVNEEEADQRRARIHENCAVIKFGLGGTWLILTGDADREAFEKHITEYHRERLPAVVLSAPHHGSRSFFYTGDPEEGDPYVDGLEAISPDYVIISAPTQEDSPHDQPHEEALEQYEEAVGAENILHTGENGYCFICDIYDDGTFGGVTDDKGVLTDRYGLAGEKSTTGGTSGYSVAGTRVDDRSMGAIHGCRGHG